MATEKKIRKPTKRTRAKDLFPNRQKYADGITVSTEKGRKSPYIVKYRPKVGRPSSKYFVTPGEADQYAMELTGKIRRDGEGFQLTDSEKAAILLWRRHREERMMADKPSMTLEKAIQAAMDAEIASDHERPMVKDVFHDFSLYKEKSAEGSNAETTARNTRRLLADISKSLNLLDDDARMSVFDDEKTVSQLETTLSNTIQGRKGGLPSKTTMKHYRRALNVFLNWAVKRKYIASNPTDLLHELKDDDPPRETYTPDELSALLEYAATHHKDMIPWLVVGAFCGVRQQEIVRLEWNDIDMTHRELKVPHRKSKTGEPRIVPMCEPAIAWLENWISNGQSQNGFLIPGDTPEKREGKQQRWIKSIKRNGLPWKHNALRHSFASYACAREEVYERVAAWLGHSPSVLNKHYRKTKTRKEADAWFRILPTPIP